MQQVRGLVWKTLLLLGCAGYQFLVYSAFHGGQGKLVRLALLLLPLLALAYWVIARAKNKSLWSFVLLVAGSATYVMEQARLGLVVAYGFPHAAIYLFLLWFFGRTLLPEREPLISRLARRVHGTLPLDLAAYTRRLTLIWCLFFAAQILTSVLLYKFASLDTWSLFINLLNFPLLAMMFVAEYVYRAVRFRHYPQASISKTIQVFVQDFSLSNSADAS